MSAVALACCCADAARAEIRVIDPATGVSRTLLADHGARVLRWTDDGAGVLVRVDKGEVARIGLDGTVTPQPQLLAGADIGPGGRLVVSREQAREYELRAPNGQVVVVAHDGGLGFIRRVAWSRDGSRLAISGPDRLLVHDTATGALLLRRNRDVWITEQAFAADGSALVISEGDRVLRLDVPSGRTTELYRVRGANALLPSALSATGRVAITRLGPIALVGAPSIPLTGDPSDPVQWSPDGQTLAVPFLDYAPDRCSPYDFQGLRVLVPGQASKLLIAPDEREVNTPTWSPDGTLLAVEVGRDWPDAKRRARRAWPRRIARDFGMPTAAGNAALRRVVLTASRALRSGESREATLYRVRRDYTTVEKRFRAAERSSVRRKIISELDRWLRAAGFPPTEGFEDLIC